MAMVCFRAKTFEAIVILSRQTQIIIVNKGNFSLKFMKPLILSDVQRFCQ